jgi:alkylhydroperoxidase/carboxymuconolactone decarboxylase family protein YurZ
MRAVDELHKDRFISDAAWKVLGEWYTPAQLLLVPFTVGHYVATASYHINVGLPDDEGVIRFDEGGNIPLRDALATTTLARPAAPRLKALSAGELSDAQREAANMFGDDLSTTAMVTTCLHNVELCRSWAPFRRYFTTATLLPARDRELLILRTSWRSHDDYSWNAHVASAKRAGLTEEEIARVAHGGFAGWGDSDALALRAADEINQNQMISDSTWTSLARRYKEPQLLEMVLAVGNAIMTSMYLNGIGVPLEAGWTGLPRESAATR